MTRVMYDAANPACIFPDDVQLIAGYIDGNYPSFAQLATRYPNAVHVPIAVWASTNDGIVGDCENGDMTPDSLVDWVLMRRAAGVDPTGYCAESSWDTCKAAFDQRSVAQPHWWVAGYPGTEPYAGATPYPGSIAHQYGGSNDVNGVPWDVSVVADFWPGVDTTVPVPKPNPQELELTDTFRYQGGTRKIMVDDQGNIKQHWFDVNGWHTDILTGPSATMTACHEKADPTHAPSVDVGSFGGPVGRIDVFAQTHDGRLIHVWWDGTKWQADVT